jgi:hypothetical protein
MSLYGFVMNSPHSYLDPTGLNAVTWYKPWTWLHNEVDNDNKVVKAFAQTANDRVNGIGDAVGIDGLAGAGFMPGTPTIFDPLERAKGECWAKCVACTATQDIVDGLVDPILGPAAPFIDAVGNPGGGGIPFVDLNPNNPFNDFDPLDFTQDVTSGSGGMLKTIGNIGLGHEYLKKPVLLDGPTPLSSSPPNSHLSKGSRHFRDAGKALKGLGNKLIVIQATRNMLNCLEKCEKNPECPCD